LGDRKQRQNPLFLAVNAKAASPDFRQQNTAEWSALRQGRLAAKAAYASL